MSAICSALVAISGFLSVRTDKNLGKRKAMPFESWIMPTAALCAGEMDKSAALTSQTSLLVVSHWSLVVGMCACVLALACACDFVSAC